MDGRREVKQRRNNNNRMEKKKLWFLLFGNSIDILNHLRRTKYGRKCIFYFIEFCTGNIRALFRYWTNFLKGFQLGGGMEMKEISAQHDWNMKCLFLFYCIFGCCKWNMLQQFIDFLSLPLIRHYKASEIWWCQQLLQKHDLRYTKTK